MIHISTYGHRLLILLSTVLVVVDILWPTYFMYDMIWMGLYILDHPSSWRWSLACPSWGCSYIAFLPIALVGPLRSLTPWCWGAALRPLLHLLWIFDHWILLGVLLHAGPFCGLRPTSIRWAVYWPLAHCYFDCLRPLALTWIDYPRWPLMTIAPDVLLDRFAAFSPI